MSHQSRHSLTCPLLRISKGNNQVDGGATFSSGGLTGEESTFKLTSLVEFSSLQGAGLRAVEGQVENQESVMSQEPRRVAGAGWRHQRLAWVRA